PAAARAPPRAGSPRPRAAGEAPGIRLRRGRPAIGDERPCLSRGSSSGPRRKSLGKPVCVSPSIFGDPESSRPTPLYGFVTENHEFIECVLHRWWLVLQRACERKGQFWDARDYVGRPDEWTAILDRIKEHMMAGPQEDS
ncbi:MAG TPA: hypothetical protein VN999_06040, partial [Thermoanaerobaculia bacterium]|nr:hypothetical protein [Thermoanaerobaculia bacterium]